MSKSSREETRAAVRAIGARLWHSDQTTDWFTVPESAENRLYELRPKMPFYCGLGSFGTEGGFRVHYDQPREDKADAIRRAILAMPDTPENAQAIGILRSAL